MMRSYVRQAVIVTDATRFEFNRRAACGVALLIAASMVLHCWCCAEFVALSLPMCVDIRAPWWVKTMIWSFFIPFVSVGVLTLALDAGAGNPFSNLVESLFYLGFPAGFVCLSFVSVWIGLGKLGTTLGSCLARIEPARRI